MTHHGDPTEHETTETPQGEGETQDRPDLVSPRGNGEAESDDVDRGLGKMERISGN